jgi:hypothetical protein
MLHWRSLSCRSGQDAVQLLFPLKKVPPVPKDHSVTPPRPRNASPPCVATGGGGGWCVSIWAHKPTWPQLYACFDFCLLSFLHLPLPSVRFLGQACTGCENPPYSHTCTAMLIINIFHQRNAFDIPALIDQNHPKSVFYIRIHSLCGTICGFQQMHLNMCPSL